MFAMRVVGLGQHEVTIDELVRNTQKSSKLPQKARPVWWPPEEFWTAAAASDPRTTEEAIEEIATTRGPYIILVVDDGDIGPFAGITYAEGAELRARTKIIDSEGHSYECLSDEDIGADVKDVLPIMSPMFVNMLGPRARICNSTRFPRKTPTGT